MQISISNPIQQTILFGIFFIALCLYTFRKKQNYTPLSYTQEIKGFAILTILFGHIGYFLSINQEFLFPFSIVSGVGVNLFLFMSGYGITVSQLHKNETIIQFYKRRLLKLFVPFWIVLTLCYVGNYFFLAKDFSTAFVVKSIFGIFTQANTFSDLNSPLWYFTLILFYYLLFPLFFNKKRPWITAIVLGVLVWFFVEQDPVRFAGVVGLYEVHYLAFSLGIYVAWAASSYRGALAQIGQIYKKYNSYLHIFAVPVLISVAGYFAINSRVGELAQVEQITSLYVMFAILLLFVIKKREFKIMSLFGLYSYEIYLFHWPILLYYDFLYKNIPAWIATLLYFALFIGLAMVLKKTSEGVLKLVKG
jgi:peptidoglycan/LPS O-acetylase OafA/YrhL